MKRNSLKPPAEYTQLIRSEQMNLNELANELSQIKNASYVEVLAALQKAALESTSLYPATSDGHPISQGYSVIARALQPIVAQKLPDKPRHIGAVQPNPETYSIHLILAGKIWVFDSLEIFEANGWNLKKDKIPVVSRRDLAEFEYGGIIEEVNPEKYGPRPQAVITND